MQRWAMVSLATAAWGVGCSQSEEDVARSEDAVAAASCSALSVEKVNDDARKFLFAEGLASVKDEVEIVPDLISQRWATFGIIAPLVAAKASTCLVVMNRAMVVKDGDRTVVEAAEPYEVIAIDTKTKAFSRFEKAITVPTRLHAAYGQSWERRGDDSWAASPVEAFYYVELEGPAVLDTYKAIAAGIEYSGFSAAISAKLVESEDGRKVAEPDGKVAFDPATYRQWKLANVSYSLGRGKSAEIQDVYAFHLDADFAGYYQASNGQVAPWSSSVRRWKLPTSETWNDVPLPPPPF